MRHPQGVYFGLSVEGIGSSALAILVQAGGRLALEQIAYLAHPDELAGWLKPWLNRDVAMAFCTDSALTHDFNGPGGERRIDRLYRKLVPADFEQSYRVASLPAFKTAGLRALRAAGIAHDLGLPIAETHPRASLAWMGARDSGWLRAVSEYSGAKCAPESAKGVPDGIVKQRCRDLWVGLFDKVGLEDTRPVRDWPSSAEIDAVVCALAARALTQDCRKYAIFPWSPSDCLIGAQGSYVLLRRVSAEPALSSTVLTPKRVA